MMDLYDGYVGIPHGGNFRHALTVLDPNGEPIGRACNDYSAFAMAERHRRAAKVKVRPCLCCGREFKSHGPGNRMCDPCRDRSEGMI